jgi:hypothetical protein
MNTASAMFSVSGERQLCPEPAVQNFPLSGGEIVHLGASGNLKF